jgi:hypothetical protein
VRVLVACEFSGVVRDAFRARGHDAWSCDLLAGEGQTLGEWRPDLYPPNHQLAGRRFHYKCDVREVLPGGRLWWTMALENQAPKWDLMIAHPPCTHLAVSGARHFEDRLDGASGRPGVCLAARVGGYPQDLHREPGQHPVEPLAQARSDHPAVAVRARRDQSHVLVAEESTSARPHQRCGGSRGTGASDGAEREPLERAQSDVHRNCCCDGGPVGEPGAGEGGMSGSAWAASRSRSWR